MTDNLKRAGIFRKSVYFFFFMVSVLDFYISNTRGFRWWALKKQPRDEYKIPSTYFACKLCWN